MNSAIFDLLIALFNTITTLVTADYFFSFFGQKNEKKVILAVYLIAFFFSTFMIENAIIKMLIMVFCIFLLSLRFEMSGYNKILHTVLLVAISTVSELIVGLGIMAVFNVDVAKAKEGAYLTLGVLLSKFIVMIALFVIKTLRYHALEGKFRREWLAIYMLPFATLVVLVIQYYSINLFEYSQFLKNLTLFGNIILILSNMLMLKLINSIQESIIKENKLTAAEELIKKQTEQYKALFENTRTIAKLRHDHRNFLLGVLGEMDYGNYKEVRKSIESELDMLETVSNDKICGNSIIDTIIGYKKAVADNKNITLNVSYRNVHEVGISGVDMAIILGNALDNAIEATEKLDNDCKVIDVNLYNNKFQTIITVKNNVLNNVAIDKLETNKGISHGYGIINMKGIAEKYGGTVEFLCEEKTFKTIIILNNE